MLSLEREEAGPEGRLLLLSHSSAFVKKDTAGPTGSVVPSATSPKLHTDSCDRPVEGSHLQRCGLECYSERENQGLWLCERLSGGGAPSSAEIQM